MLIVKKELNTIGAILMELGIPSNILGFKYLEAAIQIAQENEIDVIKKITNFLYPEIAIRFKSTSAGVERAIRYAIEIGWIRGNLDVQQFIFRYSIDINKCKPTNSEFIFAVLYYINNLDKELVEV